MVPTQNNDTNMMNSFYEKCLETHHVGQRWRDGDAGVILGVIVMLGGLCRGRDRDAWCDGDTLRDQDARRDGDAGRDRLMSLRYWA